jgi:Indolepyruvate ferredoxin oxidoreductase, alpha and beta subunits
MTDMVLLGDEAVAVGAVHAGLTAAYAYPGTPSTEILEYLVATKRSTAGRTRRGVRTRRRPTKRRSASRSPAGAR